MDRYERKKQRAAADQAASSRSGRDISGGYPGPGNRVCRESCRLDLRLFLVTYFPQAFSHSFSADHLRIVARIQRAILEGGLFALAMPRGFGKTTICIRAALWALLYGHRRWCCVIGATERDSKNILRTAKDELLQNPLLARDFPEVTYPIICTQGDARKVPGQLWAGEKTLMELGKDQVVFPTIPPSAVCGSVLSVRAITGAIRGQMRTLSTGEVLRPDLALLDDPQTRESAKSPVISEDRANVVMGDVLGLAGQGRTIAAVMTVTAIYKGDLADQFLDRQNHPDWQGERTRMVNAMPTAENLWEDYRKLYEDDLRNDGDGSPAQEFYLEHWEEMEAGAVLSWPEHYPKGLLSALEHAMRLKFRNEAAFNAEYQNEPIDAGEGSPRLTKEQLWKQVNGLDVLRIPEAAQYLTAFVDVHDAVLYYALVAWEQNYSGYVITYNTFPDQQRGYFSLSDSRHTLGNDYPGKPKEEAIFAGLEKLLTKLLGERFERDDGAQLQINRVLVDSGYVKDIVFAVLRKLNQTSVAMPSKGIGLRASEIDWAERQRKIGEQIGDHWKIPPTKGTREMRTVQYDANHWKSFLSERLSTGQGAAGSLTLYGTERTDHRLIIDHVLAEYPVSTEAKGRTKDQWERMPGGPDNHWLDCLVGCCVGASMLGAALPGAAPASFRSRPRYTLSALKRA